VTALVPHGWAEVWSRSAQSIYRDHLLGVAAIAALLAI
jgi:hypothetical protein